MKLDINQKVWVINTRVLTFEEDNIESLHPNIRLTSFGAISRETFFEKVNTPNRKLGQAPPTVLIYTDEVTANKAFSFVLTVEYKRFLAATEELRTRYLHAVDKAGEMLNKIREQKKKAKSVIRK